MNVFAGIRPLDYVVTAAMVGLAALIAVANVTATPNTTVAHPIESHSVLMVPVFVLAALPILWRRRSVLAAVGISFGVIAASLPTFGWVTRCGFALPLSVALAYAVARYAGSLPRQVVGLAGIVALQVVTLVMDSSTGGLGALGIAVPAAALSYGVGLFVQTRARNLARRSTLTVERVHA